MTAVRTRDGIGDYSPDRFSILAHDTDTARHFGGLWDGGHAVTLDVVVYPDGSTEIHANGTEVFQL